MICFIININQRKSENRVALWGTFESRRLRTTALDECCAECGCLLRISVNCSFVFFFFSFRNSIHNVNLIAYYCA